MIVTGIIATATAAKWILAGKIMIAFGGGLVTAGPVLNKAVKRKCKTQNKGVN